MKPAVFLKRQKFFSPADLIILLVLGVAVYAVVAAGNEWRAEFNPITEIDLSPWRLPYYTVLSAMRGIVAYGISLIFTLTVGYAAAKSKRAEQVIVPLLDILQSVPVLGFLPGLVIALIAIFPGTNMGLEIAAIIMIFTGQVWNMTFSFYSSLKSIPTEYAEAATVMGLSRAQKLFRLELPFSAVNLAWNSVLSMAGGWFFLSVAEAFTLGDREFRLPGIGSYMAVAISHGDRNAMLLGAAAMIGVIVIMDFVIWRPVLAWVQLFRLEGEGALEAEQAGFNPTEPLMKAVIRESRLVRSLKLTYRRYLFQYRQGKFAYAPKVERLLTGGKFRETLNVFGNILGPVTYVLTVLLIFWGAWGLVKLLFDVSLGTWVGLLGDMALTLSRVVVAVAISTLWAVPVGIWIGTSPRRVRIAQPIIQVLASFPAPMVYPLALVLLFDLGLGLNVSSVFLMLLGVQWYVLFNVLAGALKIPQELRFALSLMKASRWDKWRTLYLPSVFPALVTGWVTATGGAWNASIVAEYVSFKGAVVKTGGLGATIRAAAETQNFQVLAGGLTVMVFVVILLNRTVWTKVYHTSQKRFRMDA